MRRVVPPGAAAVCLADVRAAADRIRPLVVRTPLERSARLSELCQAEVWLKLECFQTTGSFKLRGALNALLLLAHETHAEGVVTASAGNHGLGVARAGTLLGIRSTVVVPETASQAKVDALRHSGAELCLFGQTYDQAEAHALELAWQRGLRFVSAYNDPAVVAGGGTIALEIFDDLPSARTLVVPAGGGGLIGGIGVAAHGLNPGVLVLGVQSVASPSLHAALAAGAIVPVPVQASLADGLAGNLEPGSITFDLLEQHVREVMLVEESEIALALRWLLEHEHVLVEGSAAVCAAAVLRGALAGTQGPSVLVLTGRNISAAVLHEHVLGRVFRLP